MRCLMLVSLLSVASAQLPPPQPGSFEPYRFAAPAKNGYRATENPPLPPFSGEYPPLNVTLEDGTVEELFEGDIMLTKEQRLSRKGFLNTWTGGVVPYVITQDFSADSSVIRSAIAHWKAATCLSFVQKPENYNCGPHLRFIKSSGCWSYVGMINRNSGQSVSIGNGCASLGIVAHEIGHAIGFWHEQSRRDRNSYVTVLMQNVLSGRENNFKIQASERARGVPYDLGSVMHYGGFAFTKNGLPTIVTNDIALSGMIGNREGLSHRDKHLANLMYSCDADCSCPPICRNGGYLTKNCECACPPGTSGTTCETVTGTYYSTPCGDQDITTAGTITSPNYPSLYPPGEHCVWIVTAPVGKRVQIKFDDEFKILYRVGSRCYWDWMTLHLDSDSQPEYVKCGTELQNLTYTSEGNRLALELHSYRDSYSNLQKGFTATTTFV